MYIPVNTQMDISFFLNEARESVTVPAGNFPQALKIAQDVSLPVTFIMPGSDSGTSGSLYIGTSQWYEPYIGLVRAQINSVLLVNEGLKLPIESTLELVEFTPGN
jgi:hypothetical protein